MNLGTELTVLFAFGAALFLIFLLGNFLKKPIKIILRLLLNSIIAGILMIIINLVGQNFDFQIPFNFMNCFIVGSLGLPGLIMLLIIL